MTQGSLFERGEWWQNEWQGMPEFKQDDLRPHQQVVMNFETKEDVAEFAKLIQQKIGPKTDSLWFPFKPFDAVKLRRYVDESSIPGLHHQQRAMAESDDGEGADEDGRPLSDCDRAN